MCRHTLHLHSSPAFWSGRWIFERHFIAGRRPRHSLLRIGQPTEKFSKLHALQPKRLADADFFQHAHVRPFDSNGEETKRLLILAVVNSRDDRLPMIVRFTVGYQERPRTIVCDAVLPIA